MPEGPRTFTRGTFPKTREEAMALSEKLLQQMWGQGCMCRKGAKIEFCAPPVGQPYIQVTHNMLCPLGRTS